MFLIYNLHYVRKIILNLHIRAKTMFHYLYPIFYKKYKFARFPYIPKYDLLYKNFLFLTQKYSRLINLYFPVKRVYRKIFKKIFKKTYKKTSTKIYNSKIYKFSSNIITNFTDLCKKEYSDLCEHARTQ